MPRVHPIEDYRNFGIMAHIDAGKPRPLSGFSITPARTTRSARCMKAPRRWIGWSRSRNAASPSRRPRPPRSGAASASTSSTPPATWISQLKSSVRCACSTALSSCSTATRASSRRPKPSGARATSTKFRASSSPTRWIRSAPISSSVWTTSRPASAPARSRSSCRSAPRITTRVLIDLVRMKGVIWEDEALGANYKDIDIPADLADQAQEYHDKMIEAVCELDDDAATAYLEGKMPDEETVKKLLRKAVITGAFFPVLCGSAFKNKGVQPLLDAVVDYLRRRSTCRRSTASIRQRRRRHARAERRRAAGAARLQDHGRPLRRHYHLLPHLFGHAHQRHRRDQFDQGT